MRVWYGVVLVVLFLASEPRLTGGSLHASEPYRAWQHSGTFQLLTTPEGANLPADASVRNFPVLVRLQADLFPFAEARPDGADIRFSTAEMEPLPYQIDHWDAALGEAAVWVRVPHIVGNARQTLRLYWGQADAKSESNGAAVFDERNGYVSVWHLDATVRDDALGPNAPAREVKDFGTTSVAGLIGKARHFAGKGLHAGDRLVDLPHGAGTTHSTELWFRAEKPNGRLLGWGNEQGQGKVVMSYRSPPHVSLDCYFSDGNVNGSRRIVPGEWTHAVHTYEQGCARLYINGELDTENRGRASPLNIRNPARLWFGGWYGQFDFFGDLDEVRISQVPRSAAWVRLQYENQKRLQTLVGTLVKPGEAFSVSPEKVVVKEGQTVTLKAHVEGAVKLYWLQRDAAAERVVAVDRLVHTFSAGRVTGNQTATLRLKAITATGERTREIPITIEEAVAEPRFALAGPKEWDGRRPIELRAEVGNPTDIVAPGAEPLRIGWRVEPFAVIKETRGDTLVLKHALHSGPLTITATLSNGGPAVSQSVTLSVQEPPRDPWVPRPLADDEQPVDHQFIARDDQDRGSLTYRGTLDVAAESVFLDIFTEGKRVASHTQPVAADKRYALTATLKPGLVRYRTEFGTVSGGVRTVRHEAKDLVCGDAFLLTGQSNAVATDFGKEDPTFRSEWIRTFGSMSGAPNAPREWGEARHRAPGGHLQIGYWAMELARELVERHKVPICILNGAVGGTRIDQHQRDPARPNDPATLYGRLLARAQAAQLTHGVRGILWHQGENDQGADGPSGGYGWETYREYFLDLAAAWREDYPNAKHLLAFQIWPRSCAMGILGSDNRLRDVQRLLPTGVARLSVLSTLGIDPPGGCHFPAAGYAEFAKLARPILERDHYGVVFEHPITPPNLRSARFADAGRGRIVLDFDQPMAWDDKLLSEFQWDGESGRFTAGEVSESRLTLTLSAPASGAHRIGYLDSKNWSQSRLLRGRHGLAALTFCDVPVQEPAK